MLRCIRCGACMNHCPVYQAVGGHAYGWVYPGPMGAVLTPSLIGVAEGGQLPNASTFCGRCEEVCPVRIPLPGMMRHWREREFERRLSPAPMRYGLGFWAFFASRPALYRMATGSRRARHASRRPKQGPLRLAAVRRRLDALSRSCGAAGRDVPEPVASAERSGAMSSRAAVFASIRRSLGVTGDEATRRFEVDMRLKQAPPGVVPKRGQGDVSARVATFKAEAERAQASVAEVARMGGRAGGNRPLPARKQLPGDAAHGRRSAPCGNAVERNHARNPARPLRRPRPQRGLGRLRRDRRDRHARARLRPGQSDDAQFSARQPHCRPAARGDRGGLRERVRQAAAASTARARRRARSISSPAPRARPISSRPCCSARTGRDGCISSSSAEALARRRTARSRI